MSSAARDELEWLPHSKRSPHSKRIRTWIVKAAIALSALAILVLYLRLPLTLRDPGAVTACLPPGITFSTVAEYRPTGTMSRVKNTMERDYTEITVAQKLAEIGVRSKAAKLYDASGREIRFFKGYGGGAKPPPQMIQSLKEERRRLESLYTVIELAPFDPRHSPL
jgi:hypothetical protein